MNSSTKKKSKIIDEQVFNLMDALRSPVLTFSQGWADCIPERILEIIPVSRLAASLNDEKMATMPEAVAYIMTATLEFPMHGEWVDIYTYVSCKVCQDHFGEDHWDDIKAPRELDQWNQDMLNKLRRWIYDERRKYLKDRMKSEKRLEKEEISRPDPVKIVQIEEQLKLW